MWANDMRQTLKSYLDFPQLMTILEDYGTQRGHTCILYPKFHYEQSPIEHVWCQSKKYTRAHADVAITCLRKIVPKGHDAVAVEQILGPAQTVGVCTDRGSMGEMLKIE